MPSHCTECGAELCVAEAKLFMECVDCQRRFKRKTPVRDLNQPGTEEVGRPAANWITGKNPYDQQDDE